uniref:Lon proteolytic domain-containing protein n=1 Tax=Globodera pallida TaxID=36090 RepID=A0A183C7T5_GLOPA
MLFLASSTKCASTKCGLQQCSRVRAALPTGPGPNQHFLLERPHLEVRVYPNGVSRGGPSCGVTVATAILSLALNIPTPDNLAMTGALDDQGHLLPIDGVIEKVMAAKEAGKTRIVLPADNQGQFGAFEETFADMEFVFVAHFDEVFELLFNNYVIVIVK